MYDDIERQIKDHVAQGEYYIGIHVEARMRQQDISIYDAEYIVLSGRIVERQRADPPFDYKYIFHGTTVDGRAAEAVVRFDPVYEVFYITAYLYR